MSASTPWVTVAVEGDTDAAIIARVLKVTRFEQGPVYGRKGKGQIDKNIAGYNNAARFAPWLVLRDLDQDAPCAPDLVQSLLPQPASQMVLRIAVRAAESWLLADPESISKFLAIDPNRIPQAPETLNDPKAILVDLARKSRLRSIREDLTPAPGTTARIGPAYTARVSEFARRSWRPRIAATRAPSLRRCIKALNDLRSRLSTR
jgi:hypothetical protein